MAAIPFAKYHGLGNDFVLVDAREQPALVEDRALAVRILDRHFGIGGDDLVLVLPSEIADFGMRILTPKGGELTMCGNGIRCLTRFVRDEELWRGDALCIETAAGIRETRWLDGSSGQGSLLGGFQHAFDAVSDGLL
jgi:diaminopimelate epimerase